MVYLTRREVMVAAGREAEFEEWWLEGQEMGKSQKGFRLATLGNSLGYPNKYAALIRFDTREDWEASHRDPAFRARIERRPQGLIVGRPRPTEAYEQVHRVGLTGARPADARPGFTTLVDWNVRGPAARAFESSRKELFELRQKHVQGLVVNALWKFLGNPSGYLVHATYTSREAAEQARTHPEVEAYQRTHGYSEYASAPPVIENYRPVGRVQAERP